MVKDLFTRSKLNPILKPNKKHAWENLKVYNPGAIYDKGAYHLYYRAVGKKYHYPHHIGHAVSKDGEKFKRFSKPVLSPDSKNPLEKRGFEDPRVSKIGKKYYMAFAAYDGVDPRLNIATSKNLTEWTNYGQAFVNYNFIKFGGYHTKWHHGSPRYSYKPQGKDERSKAGGIFPEKINGKYYLLFNEYKIWLAESDDGLKYKVVKKPYLEARKGNYFDNYFVEMGPPPIKTDKGWLVLYHGIDKKLYYRLGFLILDLNDPSKILFRSKKPIFWPIEDYELEGIIDILPKALKEKMYAMTKQELAEFLKKSDEIKFPKVIFCCGAVVVDGVLRIYYGASDTFICTATAKLDDVLDTIN